jgi:hypothetical protein
VITYTARRANGHEWNVCIANGSGDVVDVVHTTNTYYNASRMAQRLNGEEFYKDADRKRESTRYRAL